MESNNKLTKKELNSMIIRSFFMQIGFNYERMQGYGWLYSILPALKKYIKMITIHYLNLWKNTQCFLLHILF